MNRSILFWRRGLRDPLRKTCVAVTAQRRLYSNLLAACASRVCFLCGPLRFESRRCAKPIRALLWPGRLAVGCDLDRHRTSFIITSVHISLQARVARSVSEGIRTESGPTPTLYKIAGCLTRALLYFARPASVCKSLQHESGPNLTLAHVACYGLGTIPKQSSIQTSIITRRHHPFITPDHVPSTLQKASKLMRKGSRSRRQIITPAL